VSDSAHGMYRFCPFIKQNETSRAYAVVQLVVANDSRANRDVIGETHVLDFQLSLCSFKVPCVGETLPLPSGSQDLIDRTMNDAGMYLK
jgi:hypothetical protein